MWHNGNVYKIEVSCFLTSFLVFGDSKMLTLMSKVQKDWAYCSSSARSEI